MTRISFAPAAGAWLCLVFVFCEPAGAGPLLLEKARLASADVEFADRFGDAVALDGDTLIVGDWMKGEPPLSREVGAAYIFVRQGGVWTQEAKLPRPEDPRVDSFGFAVDVQGDTAVVTAPFDDSGPSTGAVYVFARLPDRTWVLIQRLTPAAPAPFSVFGESVAIDGHTLIVGDPEDNQFEVGGGAVYVFERQGLFWFEVQTLTPNDPRALNRFGMSVDIHKDSLAVGVPFDDARGSGSGSVYVFERSGATWAQVEKLTGGDTTAEDEFGDAIAIHEGTLVVGAARHDQPATSSGAAYVFRRMGTGWTQTQKLTARDADSHDGFGMSVAIRFNTLVVGADLDDEGGTDAAGAVYVFVDGGWGWTQRQKLIASDAMPADQFGRSVAIDEGTVAVGAPFHDQPGAADGGAVYLYAPAECTLDLTAELVNGDAHLRFELGTKPPARWNLSLLLPGHLVPIWSFAVPSIDPPIGIPVVLPNVPDVGSPVFFLSSLTVQRQAGCVDVAVLEAGAP